MTIALGGGQIEISSPMELVGSGAGRTVINGQRKSSSVFLISAGQVAMPLTSVAFLGCGATWVRMSRR